MNVQTDQFRFKNRRNELTSRAVQFKIDVDAVKDELTYISVHLNQDKRDIDELTHRSVHRLQITGIQMNLLTDQFIDYR
jgi:hypothetical protein